MNARSLTVADLRAAIEDAHDEAPVTIWLGELMSPAVALLASPADLLGFPFRAVEVAEIADERGYALEITVDLGDVE